jgi:hypothetical protein
MRNAKPISALLVATVSAAIYGGSTMLVAPPALFFLATNSSAALNSEPMDGWATLAVFAPLAGGLLGFFAGLLMASLFNLFVKQVAKPRLALASVRRIHQGTPGGREREDVSGLGHSRQTVGAGSSVSA